jgi:PEGA domain
MTRGCDTTVEPPKNSRVNPSVRCWRSTCFDRKHLPVGGSHVRRNSRLFLILGSCLVVMLLVPATAHAQRGRGRVYIRPLVVASPFYFYDPFFWDAAWWGPWPYPGGYFRGGFVQEGAARLQVTPRETEVYVDGYLAGTVDDFDGFAQRLYVTPGQHVIQLYLAGHRLVTQSILFQPGETYRMRHTMEPLGTGEAPPAKPTPAAAPNTTPPGAPPGPYPPYGRRPPPGDSRDRSTEAGTLSIRIQPTDAIVLIDGERWEGSGDERLHIQVTPGPHRVEVQKEGYQPFSTTVQVRPGTPTPLNVSLSPRS